MLHVLVVPLLGAGVVPSIESCSIVEQQAGTKSGAACEDPQITRCSYTVSDCSGAFDITIGFRTGSGSDPTGPYTEFQCTGKSCANGNCDWSEVTPVNTGSGSIDKRWQAQVQIIRTSTSQVVATCVTSVLQITTMESCFE